MVKTSEKKHWDDFWAASQDLDEVYGTDLRIIYELEKHIELGGIKVLEIGAGTGRDTDIISSRGAHAVALDYSEQSLTLMRDSMKNPVDIVCGDAFALPFADGTFDVVFHQGLLEHFRNPGDMLDENIRVLKPGGILLVDVPQRYHYYTVMKHALILVNKWFAGWETEFSVRELRGLLEARGMNVVGIYGHNMTPPIWYRGLRRLLRGAGLRLPMYPTMPAFIAAPWRFVGSLVPGTLYLNTAMVIGCVAKK